jgi:hypothetical protein
MTCAEVDQDTYNRVQNDDELIFVCESCNQEELSSTASQVYFLLYLCQAVVIEGLKYEAVRLNYSMLFYYKIIL